MWGQNHGIVRSEKNQLFEITVPFDCLGSARDLSKPRTRDGMPSNLDIFSY